MITIDYSGGQQNRKSKKIIEYGTVYAKIIHVTCTVRNKQYIIDLTLEGVGDEHFNGFELKYLNRLSQGPITFARLFRYNIDSNDFNNAAKRMLHIATLLGNKDKMLAEGTQFQTFLDYFNKTKKYIVGDKYLYFTIGARKVSREGEKYPKYYSFIVNDENGLYAISDTTENLVKFDYNKHVIDYSLQETDIVTNIITDTVPDTAPDITRYDSNMLPDSEPDKNINTMIPTDDDLPF